MSSPCRARSVWYLADAFRAGLTLEEIFDASRVDPWFLAEIEDLVQEEAALKGVPSPPSTKASCAG